MFFGGPETDACRLLGLPETEHAQEPFFGFAKRVSDLDKRFSVSKKGSCFLLASKNVFRDPKHVDFFALACQADANGRGMPPLEYPATELLQRYATAARTVDLSDFSVSTLSGRAKRREARKRRIDAIKHVRSSWLTIEASDRSKA